MASSYKSLMSIGGVITAMMLMAICLIYTDWLDDLVLWEQNLGRTADDPSGNGPLWLAAVQALQYLVCTLLSLYPQAHNYPITPRPENRAALHRESRLFTARLSLLISGFMLCFFILMIYEQKIVSVLLAPLLLLCIFILFLHYLRRINSLGNR